MARGGNAGIAIVLILMVVLMMGGAYFYLYGNPLAPAETTTAAPAAQLPVDTATPVTGSTTIGGGGGGSTPSGSLIRNKTCEQNSDCGNATYVCFNKLCACAPNHVYQGSGFGWPNECRLDPSVTQTLPPNIERPRITEDEIVFGSWRIWADKTALNIIENGNGKLYRLSGVDKKMSSETWPGIGYLPVLDTFAFENWTITCAQQKMEISCSTNRAAFVLTTKEKEVAASSVAPKAGVAAIPPNASAPRLLNLKEWIIDTDRNEMRFIHCSTSNICYLNKNGLTWDKADESDYDRGNMLKQGDTLTFGQYLTSPNKKFRARFAPDGNMVVLNESNGRVWAADSHNKKGCLFKLMENGNVVILRPDGQFVWESKTNERVGPAPYKLLILDDAKLVVRDSRDADFTW